jgi:hypothetical protein
MFINLKLQHHRFKLEIEALFIFFLLAFQVSLSSSPLMTKRKAEHRHVNSRGFCFFTLGLFEQSFLVLTNLSLHCWCHKLLLAKGRELSMTALLRDLRFGTERVLLRHFGLDKVALHFVCETFGLLYLFVNFQIWSKHLREEQRL